MRLLLLAAGGGAIGAGLRFLVNQAFARPEIDNGVLAFPYATLTVNVVGSFLMGAIVVWFGERFGSDPALRTFLATGILGGFTTFSAFSMDAFSLYVDRGSSLALTYVLLSVALSIGGLVLGLAATRWVLQ